MKYEERLPHRKPCETLERTYGLSITPATSLDITRRVAGARIHEDTQADKGRGRGVCG